jgi:hypothetical protein
MNEQYDWHVIEYRMARGRAILYWQLGNELRRFMNVRIS